MKTRLGGLRTYVSMHKPFILSILFAFYSLPLALAALVIATNSNVLAAGLGPFIVYSLFAVLGTSIILASFGTPARRNPIDVRIKRARSDWLLGHSVFASYTLFDLATVYVASLLGPSQLPSRFTTVLVSSVLLLFLYAVIWVSRNVVMVSYGQRYESNQDLVSLIGVGALATVANGLLKDGKKTGTKFLSYSLSMLERVSKLEAVDVSGIRKVGSVLGLSKDYPENEIPEDGLIELSEGLSVLPKLEGLGSALNRFLDKVSWTKEIQELAKDTSQFFSMKDLVIVIIAILGILVSVIQTPIGAIVGSSQVLQTDVIFLALLAPLLYAVYSTTRGFRRMPIYFWDALTVRKYLKEDTP